jgi:hypothetical protein
MVEHVSTGRHCPDEQEEDEDETNPYYDEDEEDMYGAEFGDEEED